MISATFEQCTSPLRKTTFWNLFLDHDLQQLRRVAGKAAQASSSHFARRLISLVPAESPLHPLLRVRRQPANPLAPLRAHQSGPPPAAPPLHPCRARIPREARVSRTLL